MSKDAEQQLLITLAVAALVAALFSLLLLLGYP